MSLMKIGAIASGALDSGVADENLVYDDTNIAAQFPNGNNTGIDSTGNVLIATTLDGEAISIVKSQDAGGDWVALTSDTIAFESELEFAIISDVTSSADTLVTDTVISNGDALIIVKDDDSIHEIVASGVTGSGPYTMDTTVITAGETPSKVYAVDAITSFDFNGLYTESNVTNDVYSLIYTPTEIADFSATDTTVGSVAVTFTAATGSGTITHDLYENGGLIASDISSGYVRTVSGGSRTYYVRVNNTLGDIEQSNSDTGASYQVPVVTSFTASDKDTSIIGKVRINYTSTGYPTPTHNLYIDNVYSYGGIANGLLVNTFDVAPKNYKILASNAAGSVFSSVNAGQSSMLNTVDWTLGNDGTDIGFHQASLGAFATTNGSIGTESPWGLGQIQSMKLINGNNGGGQFQIQMTTGQAIGTQMRIAGSGFTTFTLTIDTLISTFNSNLTSFIVANSGNTVAITMEVLA